MGCVAPLHPPLASQARDGMAGCNCWTPSTRTARATRQPRRLHSSVPLEGRFLLLLQPTCASCIKWAPPPTPALRNWPVAPSLFRLRCITAQE